MLWILLISVSLLCSENCISASSLLSNLKSGVIEEVDRNIIKPHEITNEIEGFKNLFAFTFDQENVPEDVDAIAKMDTEEVAKHWGFHAESHTVQTEDGYVLTVHRVRNTSAPSNKQVVFLQHGLLDSSFTWVVNRPDQSLAFILADLGYDVWMGNFRGNTYSRRHVTYNPDLPGKFWCFALEELAQYDLPAMLSHVLNVTGVETLNYVGHSQGTTTVLILLTTRPEYNQILKSVNLLSPIMDLEHCTSPLVYPFVRNQEILRLLKCTELLKNTEVLRIISEAACSDHSVTQSTCKFGLNAIMGNSLNQINETRLPIYMAHSPSGSSMGQVSQYAQYIRTGKFCNYDHGIILNIENYRQATPPCYPIEEISTSICLYYSDNDSFGDPKDVNVLIDRLKNGSSFECAFRVTNEMAIFNHQDFTWSVHAKELVYDHLIHTLSRHMNEETSSDEDENPTNQK